MKPHRHVFAIEAGQVFETTIGTPRECFVVEPGAILTLTRLEQNLRRDHGFEVGLGFNDELDLTYIVSMRPDGAFTPEQKSKIVGVYSAFLREPPGEREREVGREGKVIKGPWPQR
jgi:hypothetical protein